jgi:hypothetical protein
VVVLHDSPSMPAKYASRLVPPRGEHATPRAMAVPQYRIPDITIEVKVIGFVYRKGAKAVRMSENMGSLNIQRKGPIVVSKISALYIMRQ